MPESTTDPAPRRTAIAPARAYTVAALACAIVLGLTSLHASQAHRRAVATLATAWEQAGQTIEAEAKAGELTERIESMSRDLRQLRPDRSPVELSAVTATLVNRLPETATLDRVALEVQREAGARVLRGDVAGFAPSFVEMEAFAARLAQMPPFREVRVEERLRSARALEGSVGFGLTFRVDLDPVEPALSAMAAVRPRAGSVAR